MIAGSKFSFYIIPIRPVLSGRHKPELFHTHTMMVKYIENYYKTKRNDKISLRPSYKSLKMLFYRLSVLEIIVGKDIFIMADGFTLGSERVSFHYEQTIIRTFIIENFYLTVVDQ